MNLDQPKQLRRWKNQISSTIWKLLHLKGIFFFFFFCFTCLFASFCVEFFGFFFFLKKNFSFLVVKPQLK